MKKPTTKSSGNPPGIKRRRRPAVNLKRMKAPFSRQLLSRTAILALEGDIDHQRAEDQVASTFRSPDMPSF